MEEMWKTIEEFPSYEISSKGRIGSHKRKSGIRILKQGINLQGYAQIALRKGGKDVTRRISRLVALAFIPNPENKPQEAVQGLGITKSAIFWGVRKEDGIATGMTLSEDTEIGDLQEILFAMNGRAYRMTTCSDDDGLPPLSPEESEYYNGLL